MMEYHDRIIVQYTVPTLSWIMTMIRSYDSMTPILTVS